MNKDKISIVMIGHVDHGKSTLIGRLLYDTNMISQDKLDDLKKASSNELDFSYLTDHFMEERQQGITIDTSQIFFHSEKREYIIIDAPGHVEFLTNMVTGASRADAAILLVDAKEGIQEQTRRHAFVLSLMNIKDVIVVVNKMDLVDYSQKVFKEINGIITTFLGDVKLNVLASVPVSAINGDNITSLSDKLSWYKGPTLLELMDCIEPEQEPDYNGFTLPVQDIYNKKENNRNKRTVVGRVEAGTIHQDDELFVLPSGEKSTVKSVEKYNSNSVGAQCGESIGIVLSSQKFVERGNILCSKLEHFKVVNHIKARLFWLAKDSVDVNEVLSLRYLTQELKCSITKVHKKFNSSTLEPIFDDNYKLNKLEVAEVEIQTEGKLIVDSYGITDMFKRFVLVRDNSIVSGGILSESL